VFNATFSNISAISWRPVLVMEEAGVPGETMDKQPVNFITCGSESVNFGFQTTCDNHLDITTSIYILFFDFKAWVFI
jgi:hypothetical protein